MEVMRDRSHLVSSLPRPSCDENLCAHLSISYRRNRAPSRELSQESRLLFVVERRGQSYEMLLPCGKSGGIFLGVRHKLEEEEGLRRG